MPVYTDLKKSDLGTIAKEMGLWRRHVTRVGAPEESVKAWPAEPGPTLLHGKVKPMRR